MGNMFKIVGAPFFYLMKVCPVLGVLLVRFFFIDEFPKKGSFVIKNVFLIISEKVPKLFFFYHNYLARKTSFMGKWETYGAQTG